MGFRGGQAIVIGGFRQLDENLRQPVVGHFEL
jgi:hypothetical protein